METIGVGIWVRHRKSLKVGMVIAAYEAGHTMQYKVAFNGANPKTDYFDYTYCYTDELITDEAWNILYGQL